jgi:hypothetical protein
MLDQAVRKRLVGRAVFGAQGSGQQRTTESMTHIAGSSPPLST